MCLAPPKKCLLTHVEHFKQFPSANKTSSDYTEFSLTIFVWIYLLHGSMQCRCGNNVRSSLIPSVMKCLPALSSLSQGYFGFANPISNATLSCVPLSSNLPPSSPNGHVLIVLGYCSEKMAYNIRTTSLLFSPIAIKFLPIYFISSSCYAHHTQTAWARQFYKTTSL